MRLNRKFIKHDSPDEYGYYTSRAHRTGRVLCEETGVIYKNAAEAAREIGITKGYMNLVCRDPGLSIQGKHYRRLAEGEDGEET